MVIFELQKMAGKDVSFWKLVLQYFLLRRKSTYLMFMHDFIIHTKIPAWVLPVSNDG